MQDEESDIDIAVLVDLDNDEMRKYNDKIIKATSDIDYKYDKITSIIDISYNHFIHWVDVVPFYRNIEKDGVVLYMDDEIRSLSLYRFKKACSNLEEARIN